MLHTKFFSLDLWACALISLLFCPNRIEKSGSDGCMSTSGTANAILSSQTYYISLDGNDGADGLTPETAWQSIDHLNTQSFQPGDEIRFRRGDIFRETFHMSSSGTAEAPILISAFGEGRKPVFSLPVLTEWEDQGNGVFRTPLKTSEFSGVWEDQIPVQPRASNKRLTNGLWFGTSDFLYFRPSSGNPNNHEVTAIERIYSFDSGIWLSDQKYVTVSGLTFKALAVGIYTRDLADGTEGLIVEDCDFHYCQSAIFFLPNESNNRNAIIRDNYFYRNHNGVRMYTESALAPGPNVNGRHINCQIVNNEFFEEGTWNGTERWDYGFTDFEAIGLQNFSEGIISDNYIHDGVAIGIILYNLEGMSSDDNRITRNRIIDNNRVSLFLTGEGNQNKARYGYSGNMISHNIFAGEKESSNPGIWLDQGNLSNQTNYFVHNVCVGQTQQIQITQASIPAYFSIQNNIFYGVEYNISIYQNQAPAELVLDYNLYYSKPEAKGWFVQGNARNLEYIQTLGFERSGVMGDPMFVSVAERDFHLLQESPARSAGVPLPGVEEDIDGNPLTDRPDVGAYQHDVQTTPIFTEDHEALEIYPNPVGDRLYFRNAHFGSSYAISDLWGRVLIRGKLDRNHIPVAMLQAGIYYLSFNKSKHRMVKM